MLTYNTQQKKLVLPEYGRNIQRMVDHCLTIEDRDERTRCAYQIVRSMGNLFPELRDAETNNHKLWDHLYIMSGFSLDVDFPCEVIQESSLETAPEPLSMPEHLSTNRHYGSLLPRMVEKACEMDSGEERDTLVMYIANQMKKCMLAVNKDGVEDDKIFRDLGEMSHGRIVIEPGSLRLHEYRELVQATGKKKKKK